MQALTNAHLGLFTAARDNATMYEFVIGGWGNTRSVLRRSHGGPAVAERVGTALAQSSWTQMWLVYTRTGTLSVGAGKAVGDNEWMSWTDADPLVITEVLGPFALCPCNFVPPPPPSCPLSPCLYIATRGTPVVCHEERPQQHPCVKGLARKYRVHHEGRVCLPAGPSHSTHLVVVW